jgi:hypothetical protein
MMTVSCLRSSGLRSSRIARRNDPEVLDYARRHFTAIDRICNPDAAQAR